MRAAPTELNAFTRCAPGNSRCSCSIKDSFRFVVNCSTPSTGAAAAIGLVASITTFPTRWAAPAPRRAAAATPPFTASTTTSAAWAASAKLPTRPVGFALLHSASLAASRVPSMTLCPCFRKPVPSVCATTPDPMMPMFMRPTIFRVGAKANRDHARGQSVRTNHATVTSIARPDWPFSPSKTWKM